MNRITYFVLITSVAIFGAGCSDSGESTDAVNRNEEFLAEVREKAATAPPSGVGLIPSENAALPLVEIPAEYYEMGLVQNHTTTTQQMKVYNRGEGKLAINRVSTSCGCTVGVMRAMEIPPGGEAIMDITFDPSKVSGFQATRVLTIHSNDPRQPRLSFSVITHIEQEFDLLPDAIDFGDVSTGEAASASAVIRQIQKAPFNIGQVSVNASGIRPEVTVTPVPQGDWKDPAKAEYEVTAALPATSAAGAFNGNIVVNTDLPRFRTISIPYKGRILGAYTFQPQEITLRDVETGVLQKAALVLKGKDAITNVSVTNENTKVDVAHRIDEETGEVIFDLTLKESGESRLQKDEWAISFTQNGQEHSETIRVLALQPRS